MVDRLSRARDMDQPTLDQFPFVVVEKIRFSDTDRQKHVNNVLFAVFLEAGRVEILNGSGDIAAPGCFFVIARSSIDFLRPLRWPGTVSIGTRVERIGSSSVTMAQGLFQDEVCAATSQSVLVHVDEATERPAPLPDTARAAFSAGLAVS